MNLEIIHYPDKRLRLICTPVTDFGPPLWELLDGMARVMDAEDGVGLSAPQVGHPIQAMVVRLGHHDPALSELKEFINPSVVSTEGKRVGDEGCLSFPDISATVTRPTQVAVAFTALDGSRQTVTVQGLLARAVLHEADHLKGILLVDRMSQVQKLAVAGKLRRLKRAARV